MAQLKPEYPSQICLACGERWGRRAVGFATWNTGDCNVCNSKGLPVTEPRDFGGLEGWKK